MAHAPVTKSYTVRTWQSAFERIVDGSRVLTVVYSGHDTRESAEYSAARAAARYDNVVSVTATPVDHVYEYEYCGEDVYDGYRWHLDCNFSAKPGQEVTPEIYHNMLDCMPPLSLPRLPETQGYIAGFLVGEPHDHDERGRALYAAFGRTGERCFFLGYLPAR
ncbi:MAG: hypothetical protein IKK75_08170 [Clostridia bacterium]|nr:hypothetical protein [Clostridia bacterium]